MMRITLITILFLGLATVNGSPVGPEENLNKHPFFETSLQQDLDAPIHSPPLYDEYSHFQWDANPYSHHGHEGYLDLPNNSPLHAATDTIWDQGQLETQQVHDTGLGTHPMNYLHQSSTLFTQLENPYTVDHTIHHLGSSSNYANRMEQGQESSSHHPLPSINLSPSARLVLPLQTTYLTYYTRPYISKEEEEGRHERLNMFEWQKRYHENELLLIYRRIGDKWESVPRSTLTRKLFPRLNEQLQSNPTDIDDILANNESVIKDRAKSSGKQHDQPNRPNSNSNTLMSPQDFVSWITHTPIAKSELGKQQWALANLRDDEVNMILNRLARYWNCSPGIVQQNLERMTRRQFAPFLMGLIGIKESLVEETAQRLYQWFMAGNVQDPPR